MMIGCNGISLIRGGNNEEKAKWLADRDESVPVRFSFSAVKLCQTCAALMGDFERMGRGKERILNLDR